VRISSCRRGVLPVAETGQGTRELRVAQRLQLLERGLHRAGQIRRLRRRRGGRAFAGDEGAPRRDALLERRELPRQVVHARHHARGPRGELLQLHGQIVLGLQLGGGDLDARVDRTLTGVDVSRPSTRSRTV